MRITHLKKASFKSPLAVMREGKGSFVKRLDECNQLECILRLTTL